MYEYSYYSGTCIHLFMATVYCTTTVFIYLFVYYLWLLYIYISAGALDIYIGREKRRAFDSKCNRPDGTRNTIVCTVAEAELIEQCRMSKAIQ